ncbi:MAG: 5,10-methylenetetrahydrofolate reductase [Candidatus Lokiarchaeota archaeon]|nr:5,10-methylenetetrahydrofolate reductase [Candidatus Lokiarchaeota archaeon]
MVVITTKKPDEEVFEALENYKIKKIAIVSCGTCAALCQTGGTEGAKEWEDKLKEKGYEITAVIVSEDVCDNRVMRKDLRKIDDELSESDGIITLSCGLGVHSIVHTLEKKHPKLPVLITNNTEFIGETERIGRFYKRCQACGDCLLNHTGGICPIANCAKGLMNGPCGGMVDGMCEVGNYEKDCGWILIYNRLKDIGKLDLFSKLRDARDWSDSGHQQEVVFR